MYIVTSTGEVQKTEGPMELEETIYRYNNE
jgi:hypothetical protein